MSSPPIVVVGDVMVDITAILDAELARGSDSPAQIRTGWGGSGANTAAWLGAYGTPVAFVGRVGPDQFGTAAIDALTADGVAVHVGVDADGATGTCIVLVHPDGERTMLPDPGANSSLLATHLPSELFRSGAHLHLSGYTLLNPRSRAAGLAALSSARAAGMPTSLDASSAAPLAAVGAERFLRWTLGIGMLFANADEVRVLGGNAEPLVAAGTLAEAYGQVVVKLGAAGALWCTSGAEPVQLDGVDAAPVIDTTGAGDAFAAGFIRTHLAGGDPADALAGGAALAARAVSQLGARPPRG